MTRETSYKSTYAACFMGNITQAAVINMPPLLFIIFSRQFDISLDKISLLITINFATQMMVDLLSSKFLPIIGYRLCTVLANVFSAGGLLLLGILPLCMPPFGGLIIAFICMAVGGGLMEVLISPIIDAIPADNKSARMSLLHSVYCWGAVGVIGLTTLMNFLLPEKLWYVIPIVWAVIPFINTFLFAAAPIPLNEEESGGSLKALFCSGLFWVMMAIMLCGGASEQAVAQWASLFTETALGVSKAVGDILGAGLFIALMGLARLSYGIFGKRLRLKMTLTVCAVCNIVGLLLTSLATHPWLGFVGCALCGLSIGIAWPGTLSLASRRVKGGGTSMFALLALGGDIGCTLGPSVVGTLGTRLDVLGSPLKSGLLYAVFFPIVMLILLLCVRRRPALQPPEALPQPEKTDDTAASVPSADAENPEQPDLDPTV